jgi:predicted DNA-binding protein (UPF0251 family)
VSDGREGLDGFAELRRFQEQIDLGRRRLIAEARRLHDEEHIPWSEVGQALGVSRQAAWERFGSGRSA